MPFESNLFSSLLLPSVVNGLICSFIFLFRTGTTDRYADRFFGILLLLITFRIASWMLGFMGWYDSRDGFSTFMFYFPFSNWYFMGPIALFYFRSVSNSRFTMTRTDWFHLIPGLISIITTLIITVTDLVITPFFTGQPLPYHGHTQGELALNGIPVWSDLLHAGIYISVGAYSWLIFRDFRLYQRYIRQNYSFTDILSMAWFGRFLVALALSVLIWLGFRIWNSLSPLSYQELWFSFFVWGLISYYLSFAGLLWKKDPSWNLEFSPDWQEPLNTDKTDQHPQLISLLQSGMSDQKWYLDPELTLEKLARLMDVSPAAISKALNSGLTVNFNQFVNRFRVRHVQNLIDTGQATNFSLLGIALDSGFKSKATFNRVFKTETGKTPSSYLSMAENRSQNLHS